MDYFPRNSTTERVGLTLTSITTSDLQTSVQIAQIVQSVKLNRASLQEGAFASSTSLVAMRSISRMCAHLGPQVDFHVLGSAQPRSSLVNRDGRAARTAGGTPQALKS